MDKEICCPEFNPVPWDGKTHTWVNKRFIKDRVCTIFYMPLNFGSVMRRLDRKIRDSGGLIPDMLGMSDHTSKWNMDVYLAVDREINNAENLTISGEFFSKVYEGPFSDTGKWCSDFEKSAGDIKKTIKKMYMWYTTCPKCAKKYGKNYVVILGEI